MYVGCQCGLSLLCARCFEFVANKPQPLGRPNNRDHCSSHLEEAVPDPARRIIAEYLTDNLFLAAGMSSGLGFGHPWANFWYAPGKAHLLGLRSAPNCRVFPNCPALPGKTRFALRLICLSVGQPSISPSHPSIHPFPRSWTHSFIHQLAHPYLHSANVAPFRNFHKSIPLFDCLLCCAAATSSPLRKYS